MLSRDVPANAGQMPIYHRHMILVVTKPLGSSTTLANCKKTGSSASRRFLFVARWLYSPPCGVAPKPNVRKTCDWQFHHAESKSCRWRSDFKAVYRGENIDQVLEKPSYRISTFSTKFLPIVTACLKSMRKPTL